jgi:hypothetical protein
MSPPEVLHRVGEVSKKRAWRANGKGWRNFDAVGPALPAELPLLRERLASAAPAMAPALAELDAGRFCGLGKVAEAAADGVWLRDPITGSAWPGSEAYCFDIDVRSTGKRIGDVKYVWEINRLQMLHPLAAAIAAQAEERRIDQAFALLEQWASANPPYRGVNWISGIELAMRMVSLTLLVSALPRASLTPARATLVNRLVAAHGFWLARYPSRYSSANNHLVAEGLGLYLAGHLSPHLPDAAAWKREGRHILTEETGRQIFADGVGAEQSPTYQAFTMEMVALAGLIGEATGEAFPQTVADRLALGAVYLNSLMDEAGQVPEIGDNDEGRVIAQPPDREPRYVASVTAAVAGLLQRRDLLPPAVAPAHLRDHLFARPEGQARVPDGLHIFKEGGYSVGRATIDGMPAVLTFDHGPLGYLSLAAHGHADTLAVWLSVDGRQVIVDPGTYLYHSGGALRNLLRSSPAHNTLSVNETSSSQPSSAFSWSRKAFGRLDSTDEAPLWHVSASHAGYESRFGIIHRRTVAQTPEGFRITDRMDGAGKLTLAEISFLIHPDLEVIPDGHRFLIRDGQRYLLEIIGSPKLKARVKRGDRNAGHGLHAPCFGSLADARQIVFSGEVTGEELVTELRIWPREGAAAED